MRRYILLFCFSFLFSSCSEENSPHENTDSVQADTSISSPVPTFDITGDFETGFLKGKTESSFDKNSGTLSVNNLQEEDSLFVRFQPENPCEECRVEYQIWRNEKYVDVVRDTGFGGQVVYIPAKKLLEASKFGTPEYSELGIYMSVRQFHPVETGNKRFLFYISLQ